MKESLGLLALSGVAKVGFFLGGGGKEPMKQEMKGVLGLPQDLTKFAAPNHLLQARNKR